MNTGILLERQIKGIAYGNSPLKIAVVANTSWYIHNFRASLIKALRKQGHQVFIVSPRDAYSTHFKTYCDGFYDWDLEQYSMNPLKELQGALQLHKILKKQQIDAVLCYTPKGNIYSLLAALTLKTEVVNNISGLGKLFSSKHPIRFIVQALYSWLLPQSQLVFFQNKDDQASILNKLRSKHINNALLPGSGVDTEKFTPNFKAEPSVPKQDFVLISRLIKEKGIYDFVKAARLVKQRFPNVRFSILGFIDEGKTGVKLSEIQSWEAENLIEYHGATDDVRPFIANSRFVVLPSYYGEGVPRTLLESASMGKPIVTTDHPGCREAIDDGETGLLCAVQNPEDLANKMIQLLERSPEELEEMGQKARQKMTREFKESIVIDLYLSAIKQLQMDSSV